MVMTRKLLAALLCLMPTDVLEANATELEYSIRENVVYSVAGQRELLLDVFVPKSAGPHPAVLVVHGGAWRIGNRRQLRGYAEELAKRGFVCFAIDYRLAPDYKFPAQIDDCRSAVKWIRKNAAEYQVDPQRLGAIGYSAGGHLVSLLGATGQSPSEENGNTDTRLQAVVAGGAPTDFRWFPDKGKWAEYWMGGDLDAVPEKFKEASTTAFIDKNDPPMFFFNGTADGLVPLIWTLPCHAALKAAGVKTVIHKIEGADHMKAARDVEALTRAYEFLRDELQPKESVK
jgi:acetyl esterase/lipase